MKKVKLSDFNIYPLTNTAKRLKISDEEYFSDKYADYISNSRLGYINPDQNGSLEQYLNPPHLSTTSLAVGSAVHCLILQPESFTLGPRCDKPTAKLGAVIDKVRKYRRENYSIYDAIVKACKDCDYYKNQIDSKIKHIIKNGLKYYLSTIDCDESVILLNNTDYDSVEASVLGVMHDRYIQNTLHPKNMFMEPIPSFNEDALFLDVLVTYGNKYTILKLKMKADNWTINEEAKHLTLNDLKTTSKPVAWFMNKEYGSFYHYHYYRQFAMYIMMLSEYCKKTYGLTESKWTVDGNVLVVNTVEHNTRLCRVDKSHISLGRQEYERLFKMIAYYQINGNKDEVIFI